MEIMIALIYLFILLLTLFLFGCKLYGIYLCFCKRWYLGLTSIFVPFFAESVAIMKIFFKKDIIE